MPSAVCGAVQAAESGGGVPGSRPEGSTVEKLVQVCVGVFCAHMQAVTAVYAHVMINSLLVHLLMH